MLAYFFFTWINEDPLNQNKLSKLRTTVSEDSVCPFSENGLKSCDQCTANDMFPTMSSEAVKNQRPFFHIANKKVEEIKEEKGESFKKDLKMFLDNSESSYF